MVYSEISVLTDYSYNIKAYRNIYLKQFHVGVCCTHRSFNLW